MYKHYQDALAICRIYGNPQYFITFTCNVKWPEIQRFLSSKGVIKNEDRPDVIARVFQLKVEKFIKFMKEDKTFGDVSACKKKNFFIFTYISINTFFSVLYTIEFQKRVLPHCRTLIWVNSESRIKDAYEPMRSMGFT